MSEIYGIGGFVKMFNRLKKIFCLHEPENSEVIQRYSDGCMRIKCNTCGADLYLSKYSDNVVSWTPTIQKFHKELQVDVILPRIIHPNAERQLFDFNLSYFFGIALFTLLVLIFT